MKICLPIVAVFIIISQILSSAVIAQETSNALVPIETSSCVLGSLQCTKNSDESYAVCASLSNTAIKYNLQPFAFADKGAQQGNYMYSCDLFESTSQDTSRAICVKGTEGKLGVVFFYRVTDMITIATVTIGTTGDYPYIVVDAPNRVAYVANYDNPPAIDKIMNIGSPSPFIEANLQFFGSIEEIYPAAMLIIDGFLYVHFDMNPASRLARINISSFTWNQTVTFANSESGGYLDNLANDDNFIYDVVSTGEIIRCSHKNSNFGRVDSLSTGFTTGTNSLAISPDRRILFVTSSDNSLLQIVDVLSFSKVGSALAVPNAFGRPVVTAEYVFAFSWSDDFVHVFRYANVTEKNDLNKVDTEL